jgi:hypothetical protein
LSNCDPTSLVKKGALQRLAYGPPDRDKFVVPWFSFKYKASWKCDICNQHSQYEPLPLSENFFRNCAATFSFHPYVTAFATPTSCHAACAITAVPFSRPVASSDRFTMPGIHRIMKANGYALRSIIFWMVVYCGLFVKELDLW